MKSWGYGPPPKPQAPTGRHSQVGRQRVDTVKRDPRREHHVIAIGARRGEMGRPLARRRNDALSGLRLSRGWCTQGSAALHPGLWNGTSTDVVKKATVFHIGI